MQGISIFQQIYAPRVAHVVTDFDGISHNTHSPYAIGGVVGSTGKMTAIVANDQADTWHIVNLKRGNLFDAVAVLGAFDESEAANIAMRYHGQYFDAICGDVCESNTGGLQRFLNHHFYMSTNRPVYAEELAKLQDIPSTQSILWDGVQLKSHNGSSKHLLLDMMRCDDKKALLEKMDFIEEESKLDGEIAEYDALVVEAYKLENTVSKLSLAMDKATSISTLKVAKQTLSKPKTMRGFGVIQQLVSFELSDGQAVSIIFNVSDSEANASAKMTKDDLLVAWKYKLNSRDITAAVQPNATQNVSLNMIASRIMGLADANSEKFVAAQKKKDAMQTELANTNQQVKDLQGQEQALLQEIADLQKQLDEKAKNKALQEAESRAEVEGMAKTVQSAPQERPANWRTNLADARLVAKGLGIETKGKKLAELAEQIEMKTNANIINDAMDVLIDRLRLPTSFKAKKDAEYQMGYFTPVSLTDTKTGEKLVIKVMPSGVIGGYSATFINKSITDSKVLNAIDEYTGISQGSIDALIEKLSGLINHEFELNPPVTQPEQAPVEKQDEENLRKQVLALAVKNHGWNQFMMFVIGKKVDDVLYQADFGVKGEKSEITVMSRDSKINKETKHFETVGLAELISKNKLDDAAYEFNAQFESYIISQQPKTVTEYQIEPPMTNPDRDLLQSIIDGDVDPLTVDIDTVIALAEKYDGDAEITPLLDQALEVINQAEQEAAKGI